MLINNPGSVFAANPAVPTIPPGITNPALSKFVGANAMPLLIATLWKAAFVIGGIAALLFLVVGGLNWITGAGDKANTEKARTTITDAIIGLIVLAASYAIIKFIGSVLGIDILSPTIPNNL